MNPSIASIPVELLRLVDGLPSVMLVSLVLTLGVLCLRACAERWS